MTGDRGTAGLLGLVGAASAVGAAAVAGAVVSATLSHTRVDSAADMVAVGAAAALLTEPDPCRVAEELAVANGVGLTGCHIAGLVVTIEVTHPLSPLLRPIAPGVSAAARAELRIDGDLPYAESP